MVFRSGGGQAEPLNILNDKSKRAAVKTTAVSPNKVRRSCLIRIPTIPAVFTYNEIIAKIEKARRRIPIISLVRIPPLLRFFCVDFSAFTAFTSYPACSTFCHKYLSIHPHQLCHSAWRFFPPKGEKLLGTMCAYTSRMDITGQNPD